MTLGWGPVDWFDPAMASWCRCREGVLRRAVALGGLLLVGGTMTVSGGGEEWQIPLEPATSFDVSVLGILPQTSYRIELVLQAGRTSWQVPPLAWTSPALPEDFPRTGEVV